MPDLRDKGPGGLNLLTVAELSAQLEQKQTTSVAIVQACLDRIKSREPDIRAWAYLDPEAALAEARACDEQPRRSPLHGIPIGIKDIFDTSTCRRAMARRSTRTLGRRWTPHWSP